MHRANRPAGTQSLNLSPADQQSLVNDLQVLGLTSGDCVLVHTAFKSLGPLSQGPDTLISALQAVIGVDGSICMPALSYACIDWQQPIFDVQQTKSCVGFLAEYFRSLPGVQRSLHLSHSVSVLGKQARFLTGEHHLDNTPCGIHSPFVKMRDLNAKILMLGCGLGPNTSMHAIEESMQLPYVFMDGVYPYRCIDANGQLKENMRSKRHALFDQYYERVRNILPTATDKQPGLRSGPVAAAQAHLIECKILWERATACLRDDPFYFIAG